MKIIKSEQRITLTVVGEQHREFEEPRVLDQRGNPWEVVDFAEKASPNRPIEEVDLLFNGHVDQQAEGGAHNGLTEVTLRPLRADMPWDVSEVWPYSARLSVAQRNRILDYMSQIEACDFEIKTVFACAEDSIDLSAAIPRKNDQVKPGVVFITAGGFLWGPLPISPLEKAASWPYQAAIKTSGRSVYVEPVWVNRCDVISVPTDGVPLPEKSEDAVEQLYRNVGDALSVPPGSVRINLEWGEALAFARSAAELGWERAVALHFPKGLRLGIPSPGGVIDETLVRG